MSKAPSDTKPFRRVRDEENEEKRLFEPVGPWTMLPMALLQMRQMLKLPRFAFKIRRVDEENRSSNDKRFLGAWFTEIRRSALNSARPYLLAFFNMRVKDRNNLLLPYFKLPVSHSEAV